MLTIELDYKNAPVTASNFEQYVKDGHYNGLIFHRVIPGFMIQGGGFKPGISLYCQEGSISIRND